MKSMNGLKARANLSRNTKRSQGDLQKAKGNKPRRVFALCLAFIGLLILFLWNGGIVGFTNAMAKNAIASKNLDSAEWWLRQARVVSTDGLSDFLQARVDRKRGKLDKMATNLKVAFDKGIDPQILEREQTLALASLGRFNEGMERKLDLWLQRPESEHGEIFDAYANGLAAVSRFDEAMNLLLEWEQVDPLESDVNYRIARIHEHLLQYLDAESQYRKALSKAPLHRKASYNLARVLQDQRRPDEALKLYQDCNQGDSKFAAKTGMAICYKSLGETEAAQKILREVLQSDYEQLMESYRSVDVAPERFIAASELGCIETELGEYSEAKKHLELALDKHPLDSVARYSYAVALRGLGLKEQAEENFEKTRSARASLDQVTALQELLRIDPKDTASRIKIGKIVLTYESERTGVFWIQSVFSYDPKNEEAHQALAEYFASKRNASSEDLKRSDYHRSFVKKNK
jgi:tetratricopeptide (TPR) repeat protein